MTLQEQFTQEIEKFLTAHRLKPTTFGWRALKDPSFVHELRTGRCPSLGTVEKVRTYMRTVASASTQKREDA